MAAAGLSTLGITFGYGTEATAGTKPTSFKQLTRINSIGGINIEPEQIDASALEDAITRYVKGRADTGGSFPITVNLQTPQKKSGKHLSRRTKRLPMGKECGLKPLFLDLQMRFLWLRSHRSRYRSRKLVRMSF